ncbi:MAG TPA: ScyD/ScyE family protein [Angustibacter sp.]|nr:ScyD/ScyE family protein [Angustibacter sp.]
MRRRILTTAVTAAAAAAALVAATPLSASAHGDDGHEHGRSRAPRVTVVNDAVVAPFQLALSRHAVYVADGGTSQVSRILRDGSLASVATGPQPGEVAGVAFDASGRSMAYTTTDYSNGTTQLVVQTGHRRMTVDLSAFEQQHNPDADVTYGIENPSDCVQQAFAPLGGATMKGGIDSHPYSVASLGHGAWVVADAGGNDLLKVDGKGHVSVIAVLPRQPLEITADIAAGLGLPDCVVGVTYNFEPVPTDVEVGEHGQLYVSLLPGGPEDPSLGARGSVYRVGLSSGHSSKVAGGFLGATNLALGPDHTIYVAELFGGRISMIKNGHVTPYLDLPGALAVEWGDGHLYAATMAPMDDQGNPVGNGTVVRIDRR